MIRRFLLRGKLLPVLVLVGAFALTATAFAAYYQGTPGDDTIVANQGSAQAYLLEGNDTFFGHPGEGGGADHIHGGPDNDDLFGRSYDDTLRGASDSDEVFGGTGADGLHGGGGSDTLTGGKGQDRFKPGLGEDTCIGERRDYGFPRRCENVEFE